MDPENDTETGGEALSVEQAAAAYAKTTTAGADNGQPAESKPAEGEEADDDLLPSDEDEGESEGEPEDEEGQAEGEADEEPGSDQGRFVASNGKVRLPDGTVSTVADLIQGNLRDRDYRQKTMELADIKRSAEEQSSALKATQQQVTQQQAYMAELLQSIMPQAPDPSLLQSNPVAYIQAKEHYESFTAHLNYLQQQMDERQQTTAAETQKQQEEKSKAEWGKLQEVLPALKDEKRAKAFFDDVKSAGAAAGFTADELMAVVPYDHRMALVLRKAAQWDRLQASKPKVQQQVQGRPPVQRGGKRLTPDAQRGRQAGEAMNRLKQTGRVEDAAAAYLASLNKG